MNSSQKRDPQCQTLSRYLYPFVITQLIFRTVKNWSSPNSQSFAPFGVIISQKAVDKCSFFRYLKSYQKLVVPLILFNYPSEGFTSRMIRVDGLTKKFATVTAVDHINFSCHQGEVFAFLGPNGAGKTTTIRLILAILTPTEGRITVNGIDVRENPESARRQMGAVLEENGLYDRLTAWENVSFFGELYGMEKNRLRQRIEELFALLGIEEFAYRRAGGLSKGTKQKVAVARALVADPPVLLLDEPTAGLDVLTQKTILSLIKTERDRGKCIIYSTHIMSEAEQASDRIAIIHHGRIRALGTPEELKQKTGKAGLEDVFLEVVREQL